MSTITTVRCASSCFTGRLANTILDRMEAASFARPNGRLEHVLINGDFAHRSRTRFENNSCLPLPLEAVCDHSRAVLIMFGERALFSGYLADYGDLFHRFTADDVPGTTFICDYKLYESGFKGEWWERTSRSLYI
jgi:hypothetical protein